MDIRDLLAFFNLTGHIWVLRLHKKGPSGGNYLYKCDSLNDLLSCVTAFNPKALKPSEGWKVTLTNTKEKKDYSSLLDMKELYQVTHETKYIVEKTYGIN